jgi:outer membrane protein assembly factor BamD (BamD/ComL family)
MKTNSYLLSIIAVLFIAVSCTSPKEKSKAAIKEKEDQLFGAENKMVDRVKAKELIELYTGFADQYPDDADTPELLFKAGDMSMNLNMGRQAIQIFDRIMNTYPDFEKVPQCLFLKGYIYENELGDLDSAKKIYEEFLQKYPDDEFADDAEMSIKNLGKSPEELIKEFEEKAKDQESI